MVKQNSRDTMWRDAWARCSLTLLDLSFGRANDDGAWSRRLERAAGARRQRPGANLIAHGPAGSRNRCPGAPPAPGRRPESSQLHPAARFHVVVQRANFAVPRDTRTYVGNLCCASVICDRGLLIYCPTLPPYRDAASLSRAHSTDRSCFRRLAARQAALVLDSSRKCYLPLRSRTLLQLASLARYINIEASPHTRHLLRTVRKPTIFTSTAPPALSTLIRHIPRRSQSNIKIPARRKLRFDPNHLCTHMGAHRPLPVQPSVIRRLLLGVYE